jgi:hypothetical protein
VQLVIAVHLREVSTVSLGQKGRDRVRERKREKERENKRQVPS